MGVVVAYGGVPLDAARSSSVPLPVVALRNLHAHAAVHLDVEWRDLGSDHWSDAVDTERGRRR